MAQSTEFAPTHDDDNDHPDDGQTALLENGGNGGKDAAASPHRYSRRTIGTAVGTSLALIAGATAGIVQPWKTHTAERKPAATAKPFPRVSQRGTATASAPALVLPEVPIDPDNLAIPNPKNGITCQGVDIAKIGAAANGETAYTFTAQLGETGNRDTLPALGKYAIIVTVVRHNDFANENVYGALGTPQGLSVVVDADPTQDLAMAQVNYAPQPLPPPADLPDLRALSSFGGNASNPDATSLVACGSLAGFTGQLPVGAGSGN